MEQSDFHRNQSGFRLYSKIEEEDFFDIPGLNEETFSFSFGEGNNN